MSQSPTHKHVSSFHTRFNEYADRLCARRPLSNHSSFIPMAIWFSHCPYLRGAKGEAFSLSVGYSAWWLACVTTTVRSQNYCARLAWHLAHTRAWSRSARQTSLVKAPLANIIAHRRGITNGAPLATISTANPKKLLQTIQLLQLYERFTSSNKAVIISVQLLTVPHIHHSDEMPEIVWHIRRWLIPLTTWNIFASW